MRAQKYVDNTVSKTVNLPPDATLEDVRKICRLAYKLKCKGITIYRYGSKREQVLYVGPLLTKEMVTEKHVSPQIPNIQAAAQPVSAPSNA